MLIWPPKNSKTHGQYGQFARLVVGNIRVMADFGQNHIGQTDFGQTVCVCACVAWVLVSRFPCGGVGFTRDRPSPGPPIPWTAVLLDRPKSPQNSFFSSSLGGLLVEFWLCLEAGVSHDSRELQTCTFEHPGASNTTKIPRKDPQEKERRKKNCWRRREKMREISGPPPFGLPLFLSWAPHPSNPHPSKTHKKNLNN